MRTQNPTNKTGVRLIDGSTTSIAPVQAREAHIACALRAKRDCDDLGAIWRVDETTCAGAACTVGPPLNDDCAVVAASGTPLVGTSSIGFATQCTTPPFAATPVGCRSEAGRLDWSEFIPFHLYGSSILPGATYEVTVTDEYGLDNCTDEACDQCSFSGNGTTFTTGAWGDVVAPFGGGSQPDFVDISALVAGFQGVSTAPIIPRGDLVGLGGPGTPNVPDQQVDFGDISAGVGAFEGEAYPYTIDTCP